MPVRDLGTEAELERLLGERAIAVLDFWAPWCPPCREFLPVFEAAASRNPDLAFARINTQVSGELADAFGVESIPSLVVIRERVMVASHTGYLSSAQLDSLFGQVRALDMDALREEMAQAGEGRESP